jgi:nucleoid-associated protein YgaU
MAIGAVVIAVAVGIAWRVKISDQAALAAASPALPTAPPGVPVVDPGKASPAPGPAETVPSFDVARIGADGRAVIAGRAASGVKIVVLDGGKEIARGQADGRGEWVVMLEDPPLAPGPHEIRIVQHAEGHAPVTSEQVVVAVVPTPADDASKQDNTLVMVSPPSGAATLLQPPSAEGVPKSADLQVSTIDYDDRGETTITGRAAPGAGVRAYLDDKLLAEGKAGADGYWRLLPAAPVAPGEHRLRIDRLAPGGKPSARLELKFERQKTEPSDNRRLRVVRGDNLWNIARAHYGEGLRYTMIFAANQGQIRDPNLIYPGQVFSLPKVN